MVVLMCAFAEGALGQDCSWMPTSRTHAWSRFGPLAWKEVRVCRTAFDENGEIERSSETVTRTRVRTVGRTTFSLNITSTVVAAGRRFPPTPQTVTLPIAPDVDSSKELGTGVVTIDGDEYPTRVIELVTESGGTGRTSKLHYCERTCPQMLQQHTITRDLTTNAVTCETTVTVTHLNKLCDVLAN